MTDNITIPCHPAIGIHGWTFTINPELARQIVALAADPTPDTPPDDAQAVTIKGLTKACDDLEHAADHNAKLAQQRKDELDKALADLAAVTAERDQLKVDASNHAADAATVRLERDNVNAIIENLTIQRGWLAQALDDLVDAIDAVQDWDGTRVGDARSAALAVLGNIK